MSEQPAAAQPKNSKPRASCSLCGKQFAVHSLVPAGTIRPSMSEHIAARHPGAWGEDALVCKACLAQERYDFLLKRLGDERGDLSVVEQDIAHKIANHKILAADIEKQFETQSTFGQRLADHVAVIGGSWPFVAGFFTFLLVWIGVNTLALRSGAFDPYPYILLNLILSCLAAIQAPIIMMSQNRLGARDRMQATQDFRINLKAELEVASLHEKVDHLLHSQWEHLVELQEMQIELLNELVAKRK